MVSITISYVTEGENRSKWALTESCTLEKSFLAVFVGMFDENLNRCHIHHTKAGKSWIDFVQI